MGNPIKKYHNKMLKRAEINDIPMIQSLARTSWKKAYAEILSSEQLEYMLETMYSEAELLRQINLPDYFYYLIQIDKKSVGFLGFEQHYEPDTTKLHRLYLLEEWKGKGLGKLAIDFLKKESRDAGNRRIILNVNKDNLARKMYEKQGFKVFDEGVFDIGNGYVMDDYLMEFCV